ncbi:MAG: rRNA maturation RNase YbeY [Balneolaceae bacterium]
MNDESPTLQIYNESGIEIPLQESELSSLIEFIAKQEHCRFSFVEVVYVGEDEIVEINKEHLQRDYVTDIITFRYDDDAGNLEIEGTLFCCAPRITEQARELDEPEKKEFLRIFIHGILHLIGYEDSSSTGKNKMTELEDIYLAHASDMPKL